MFWIIWLILWILISLPWAAIFARLFNKDVEVFGFLSLLKMIVIIVIGVLLIASTLNDAVMTWALIILLILSLLYDFIFLEHGYGMAFCMVAIVIICFVCVGFSVVVGNNNAIYFDNFIEKSTGFPMQNEVPNNMLRLTTKELAESIASQHMGEFGSAVEITSSDVGMIDGRLYWLVMVAKHEQWGQKYNTAGIIAVDANDPDKPVKIIKEEFAVAENLDYNPILGSYGRSVSHGYFGINTANMYGDAYPVINPDTGKWSLIMTSYAPDMWLVQKYNGVYQLDQKGNLINYYKDEVPSWVIKPFDENGFLEQGISNWGKFRRGDDFDLFAGGFLYVPPSNDRLEITEDTRFVYDPDSKEIAAMVVVNPIRDKGELSLAGVFKATSTGIEYYDLRDYDLMSGIAASGIVKSKITSRSGSEYYTSMELLYPMTVGNQTKYVWFVPIYYRNEASGMIGLAGLGIVDAQSADKVVVEYTGKGITGEILIQKAKKSFQALYSGEMKDFSGTVKGTIVSKYDFYIKEGGTRGWMIINTPEGTKSVLVISDLLSDAEMLGIQKVQKGSSVELLLDNDNIIQRVF